MKKTDEQKAVGIARIIAGVIILSTGIMKYSVPMLWDAWSRQLQAAELPFYGLTLWTVPAVEILVGTALALGIFARLSALVVSGIMVVATYVHLTVNDPSVFPLQPHLPIAPLMVLGMAGVVLVRGAGAFRLERACGERTTTGYFGRVQESAS